MDIRFSIVITTRNRIRELHYTLQQLEALLAREDVECIICDDGSTDGTSELVKEQFPAITLLRHTRSIGLIGSRNELLARARGKYAISLDDDAHFLTQHPLEKIEALFTENPDCGVIAFRIYWGLIPPAHIESTETSTQVRGFVGCGHAWRMDAWKRIPNYPEWFIFYGEEDFASYQLFRNTLSIWYAPEILVHHRVDVKSRKQQHDYRVRLRRSLRSGWYLMFLFFPWKTIPRRLAYSLWIQLKKRTFTGDLLGSVAILQALGDLLWNIPRILQNRTALSPKQFAEYNRLDATKIYWQEPTQEF